MKEALFYKKREDNSIECQLCPHHCIIRENKKGICGVRQHKNGKLYTLVYNKPCSLAIDPIEKKPLYHFMPGSKVFSFGTVGCNLDCEWCQNHDISHPEEQEILVPQGIITPEQIIKQCKERGCELIAFTYNEPTVYYEYMLDVAKLAHKNNLKTVMVSNGFIEKEPLQELLPYLDAANIDIKGFNEVIYKKCTKGILPIILNNILAMKTAGIHLEITTLIIPEVNDSELQIRALYKWIEQHLGKEQVVHISRFFPYYKMLDKEPTPLKTLEKAAQIAKEHVMFAYLGNVSAEHDTYCPTCNKKIINRDNYQVDDHTKKGKCSCGYQLPGAWK